MVVSTITRPRAPKLSPARARDGDCRIHAFVNARSADWRRPGNKPHPRANGHRGTVRESGRESMIGKTSLALIAAFSILGASAALADCAETMKSNDAMMMKSHDMAKKDMAMKEQHMAKDMMDKKDEAGCMMHADKAMEALK
jgi:hypothetical protein